MRPIKFKNFLGTLKRNKNIILLTGAMLLMAGIGLAACPLGTNVSNSSCTICIDFNASPSTIYQGQCTTLTLSVSDTLNEASCNFPIGSFSACPGSTYTYTATCSGSGGTVSHSATVAVIPPPPTGLNASCPAPPGTSATVWWNASPGAAYYALRINNQTNGWNGSCDGAQLPGDVCQNIGGTSFSFSSQPGVTYNWWVHACNAYGCSDAAGAGFICICQAGCGAWSTCSVYCGGGTQSRTCARTDCSTYTETQSCNTQSCCGAWSAWGACSVSCGGGTQTRTRTCTNPTTGATYTETETQSCNTQSCNNSPSATNLSITQTDSCLVGWANATFSWTFTDPDSDTQSAYQIQVDNNSNFSSPEVDSGKVISSSNSYATQSGKLSFNTTYYWRLMVWDSKDTASSWISGTSFTTPRHAYPYIDFTWIPQNPTIDESTQFTDQSQVYGGTVKSSWSWTFQNGSPSTSAIQNPLIKFLSTGSKTITLKVTDSDGFNCTGQKTLNTLLRLPDWKEIPPF